MFISSIPVVVRQNLQEEDAARDTGWNVREYCQFLVETELTLKYSAKFHVKYLLFQLLSMKSFGRPEGSMQTVSLSEISHPFPAHACRKDRLSELRIRITSAITADNLLLLLKEKEERQKSYKDLTRKISWLTCHEEEEKAEDQSGHGGNFPQQFATKCLSKIYGKVPFDRVWCFAQRRFLSTGNLDPGLTRRRHSVERERDYLHIVRWS